MSRYIDADAIDIRAREGYRVDGVLYLPYRDIRKSLDSAPSIDIVRCKECIYREKYPCNNIEFYECNHLRLHGTKVGVNDDWFCADGKREE